MRYKKSLFIFRRDLRLDDNNGLIAALENSEVVLCCFIFDERQITAKNSYRSLNAIQFMVESLEDLEKQLKKRKGILNYFYGIPHKIVKKIIKDESIDAIYINRDYTPFSIERDKAIQKEAIALGADFFQFNDALLLSPEQVKTGNGDPYSIYTPFYKKALSYKISEPLTSYATNFYSRSISGTISAYEISKKINYHNNHLIVKGGSSQADTILKNLKNFEDYAKVRDYVAIPTTHLSAHNKFGTVSIRKVYYSIVQKLGYNHGLLRQLYWRDFFTHVAYHSPFVFGAPFHEKYKKIEWSTSQSAFKRWCQGMTGFPIVDAAMRQLQETGYMHNRARLIVGSFLVKDLHINWLWGEKFFAQNLTDYDPCVNNGNWQWIASTGCDSQPYFRIFNPWLQQKKFDPECIYIKQWIPELRSVSPKIIHSWYQQKSSLKGYPTPMVDHSIEAQKTKQRYVRAAHDS